MRPAAIDLKHARVYSVPANGSLRKALPTKTRWWFAGTDGSQLTLSPTKNPDANVAGVVTGMNRFSVGEEPKLYLLDSLEFSARNLTGAVVVLYLAPAVFMTEDKT